ncbi:hypothetical protein F4778DRAFT_782516 [Xylariomycetidae sp. FL2044]|nr:hypothetical protein F4778DRAFT_782516 [Xylariomycetidae sp. FL2044]
MYNPNAWSTPPKSEVSANLALPGGGVSLGQRRKWVDDYTVHSPPETMAKVPNGRPINESHHENRQAQVPAVTHNTHGLSPQASKKQNDNQDILPPSSGPFQAHGSKLSTTQAQNDTLNGFEKVENQFRRVSKHQHGHPPVQAAQTNRGGYMQQSMLKYLQPDANDVKAPENAGQKTLDRWLKPITHPECTRHPDFPVSSKEGGRPKDENPPVSSPERLLQRNAPAETQGIPGVSIQKLTAEALRNTTGACPKSKGESVNILSLVSSANVAGEEDGHATKRDFRNYVSVYEEDPVEEIDWNAVRDPKAEKERRWRYEMQLELDSNPDDWWLQMSSVGRDFILWWAGEISLGIENNPFDNLPSDYADRDIDTNTGYFLEPVEYTTVKRNPEWTPAESFRTAANAIEKLQSKLRAAARQEKRLEKARKKREKEIEEMESEVNPDAVLVPCHLRPAEEKDMEGVAAIFNREVKEGYTLMDTQPLSVRNFEFIFRQCMTENIPFVVAIEGWVEGTTGKIVGFSFLDVSRRGIMGSMSTRSSLVAKLNVVVEPEFRHKKIGLSLIDFMLSCTSVAYSPRHGYQWAGPEQKRSRSDLRFLRPEYNSRKWRAVEMEVLIPSGKDKKATEKSAEYQRIWNFLEATFTLLLQDHQHNIYRDEKSGTNLDRLTFKHVCRFSDRMGHIELED